LIALASRYFVSSDSKAWTGSSALVSSSVSTSESLSPFSPPEVSSSSSATTLTKLTWLKIVWRSSSAMPSSAATSASVGRAVQPGLEGGVRLLDLAGLVADRARDPVDRAQLVDDRALDAADRVGLELDRALEVELLDRVDEPEDAVRDEVGLLDVRRQAHADAAGDVLHERRVVQDQPLAQPLLPRHLVLAPELGDGRLDLGPLLVADAGVAPRAAAPWGLGRRLTPAPRSTAVRSTAVMSRSTRGTAWARSWSVLPAAQATRPLAGALA
jgi:hypothetical protein